MFGNICSFTLLLGRLCLSSFFILNGAGKFFFYDNTIQHMTAKGMTLAPFFLVLAGSLEILSGLFILIGYKTRSASAILLIYLIPVIFIFHDFWNANDLMIVQERFADFLKDVGIIGGLLYIIGAGAGKWSIDACCCTSCDRIP